MPPAAKAPASVFREVPFPQRVTQVFPEPKHQESESLQTAAMLPLPRAAEDRPISSLAGAAKLNCTKSELGAAFERSAEQCGNENCFESSELDQTRLFATLPRESCGEKACKKPAKMFNLNAA